MAPLDDGVIRRVYHTIDSAIFVHDAESGEILDVNETASELYGHSRSELRELPLEAVSADDQSATPDDAHEHFERAREGERQVYDWRAEDADGNRFWVEVDMQRLAVDENGYVLVILHDITGGRSVNGSSSRPETSSPS